MGQISKIHKPQETPKIDKVPRLLYRRRKYLHHLTLLEMIHLERNIWTRERIVKISMLEGAQLNDDLV